MLSFLHGTNHVASAGPPTVSVWATVNGGGSSELSSLRVYISNFLRIDMGDCGNKTVDVSIHLDSVPVSANIPPEMIHISPTPPLPPPCQLTRSHSHALTLTLTLTHALLILAALLTIPNCELVQQHPHTEARIQRIDDTRVNPRRAWAEMGSPMYPTQAQINKMMIASKVWRCPNSTADLHVSRF